MITCSQLTNHGISNDLLDKVEKLTKAHYTKCMEPKFKEMLAEKGLNEVIRSEINDLDWESALFLCHLPASDMSEIPILNKITVTL